MPCTEAPWWQQKLTYLLCRLIVKIPLVCMTELDNFLSIDRLQGRRAFSWLPHYIWNHKMNVWELLFAWRLCFYNMQGCGQVLHSSQIGAVCFTVLDAVAINSLFLGKLKIAHELQTSVPVLFSPGMTFYLCQSPSLCWVMVCDPSSSRWNL